VQRKSADHDRMKLAMTRAMAGAQKSSFRKSYGRVQSFDLPEFLKGVAS